MRAVRAAEMNACGGKRRIKDFVFFLILLREMQGGVLPPSL